ncbi:hypothetical protein AB0G74_02205 [Streptomyces sp. NPDC020875]|uniref:hypothetical protein n=1 Tax=Streptomyces sp. NPDC020875 TaxID=3154898 RepID=UPI0033CF0D0A
MPATPEARGAASQPAQQQAATWHGALDVMTGIRSSRTVKAVRSMRSDLARFQARDVRPAAELDERVRVWLRHEGAA